MRCPAHPSPARSSPRPRLNLAAGRAVEALEGRTLFNATVSSAIAPVSAAPGGSATTIPLGSHFTDPNIQGTAVEIETPVGAIPMTLFDSKTPQTVANFLHYISSGEYANTIIHRSIPGFVIQGGGYTTNGAHINTFGMVTGEPGVSNTTGTIAMALSNGPNSGTSEWFFNLANNNGTTPGNPNLDNTSDGGPFTVFGKVIYNGLNVVSAIAALPQIDGSSVSSAWTNLPVRNASNGTAPSNLVTINPVVVPALTYTATSDNAALVNPTVSGSNLVLNYGTGTGTAHVTVTATDLGGNHVTDTFAVGVGSSLIAVGGSSGNRIIRFTSAAGGIAQVSLSGPGSAAVSLAGSGITQSTKHGVVTVTGSVPSISIATTGTTSASTLNITGRAVTVTGITTDAALRAINGRTATLTGNLTAAASVASVDLAAVSAGTLTFGGSAGGTPVSLKVGSGTSESVTSADPIALLTAKSWSAGGTISAPSIARVMVTDSFAPNVSAGSLGTFRAGSITGGSWVISGNAASIAARSTSVWSASFGTLGKLAAAGTLEGSTIRATGNIGSVSALAATSSNIFAGIGTLPLGHSLPATAADFTSNATIGSVRFARSDVNTNVAAGTLGRLNLGTVQVANGGTSFGVAGHSITALTATAGGKRLRLANVNTQAAVTAALATQGIAPQDLVIRIV